MNTANIHEGNGHDRLKISINTLQKSEIKAETLFNAIFEFCQSFSKTASDDSNPIVPDTPKKKNANANDNDILPQDAAASNSKVVLPSLVYVKAGCNHWYNLHIADRQTDKESPPPPLRPYLPCHFRYAEAVSVAHHPAHLHVPPDNFKRV